MNKYPDTTLDEFIEKATAFGRGVKSGPTICYRGLNRSDKVRAIGWLSAECQRLDRRAKSSQLRLSAAATQAEYREAVDRMKGLLDRLMEVGIHS